MTAYPIARPRLRTASTATGIARAASQALLGELACYPKPGLVSFVDNGAHEDMNAATFLASIDALHGYFQAIAAAGVARAGFDALRDLGLRAEQDMLAATGGVNTHRGAIFAIGFLAAAAGRLIAMGQRPRPARVAAAVGLLWGREIAAAHGDGDSHGATVASRYGAGGARAQAAAGFPVLRRAVLPAMAATRMRGGDPDAVALDGFFASLATLEDTNLLYRGGPTGLDWARAEAAAWRRAGGALAADGKARAIALHQAHTARNLSPGGSADMLSAALFLTGLEG